MLKIFILYKTAAYYACAATKGDRWDPLTNTIFSYLGDGNGWIPYNFYDHLQLNYCSATDIRLWGVK